jgi:hypothetical protein
VIVVYKVDRLTRALSDFAKLVEVFDRRGVSFVSITQQFNTTTSMGRPLSLAPSPAILQELLLRTMTPRLEELCARVLYAGPMIIAALRVPPSENREIGTLSLACSN